MKNIRTCVACRNKFDKEKTELIKITKNNDELFINKDNRIFGRSVYICKNKDCINKVIKNKILNKVLKKQNDEEIYKKLGNIL